LEIGDRDTDCRSRQQGAFVAGRRRWRC